MTYSILINGSPILSGHVLIAIAAGLFIVAALIMVAHYLYERIIKGLRENEVLKYEFITIIAHKFRTPLSSMKWLIESLIQEETDGYKKQNLVDMQSSNQKLIDLTGTLVELADADSAVATGYQFEKQSLVAVGQNLVNTMRSHFKEKNQSVSFETPNGDVSALIDKPRMEFVFQTMLENANIYTPPGRNIRVGVAASGKNAVFYVQDLGIGIEAADLPRIFTKFYRTEGAKLIDTEGFGVALYLAKTIVSRHNGTISVASDGKDKGTTFNVSLPLA